MNATIIEDGEQTGTISANRTTFAYEYDGDDQALADNLSVISDLTTFESQEMANGGIDDTPTDAAPEQKFRRAVAAARTAGAWVDITDDQP